jgi:hypothetical protein
MDKNTVWRYVNLLAVIATITVNALANSLPLNGQTTGEISGRFQVFFVPAGYVFSIWGVIYLALLAFSIYQILPSQRENPRLRNIGYLFLLSCIANMAWLFLWHYEYFIATVGVMIILLLSLIGIYSRLQIGRVRVKSPERWCVYIPFSIYLGWITVATIANITTVLYYVQWSGWGIRPEVWALIMLATAFLITTAVALTRRDLAYILVIIWAFAGIAVKHGDVPLVAVGAWIATAFTAGLFAVTLLSARHKQKFTPAH